MGDFSLKYFENDFVNFADFSLPFVSFRLRFLVRLELLRKLL
jgi:hypothetical protein